MASRVVIADDHPVVCVGLAKPIAAQGWEVCATAADGEEAVARATAMRKQPANARGALTGW
jgi:DNA-binding NarL/FixJ family response regulator